MVLCFSFLESVPGVCGVKKFMVASESKIPKTVFCTVVLEVSSLQLNVKLFNVGSGNQHLQRPTSVRCFSDPPMVWLGWLAVVIRATAGGWTGMAFVPF